METLARYPWSNVFFKKKKVQMGWKFNSKWQVGLVLKEEKYRLISLPKKKSKKKKKKKKNIYI